MSETFDSTSGLKVHIGRNDYGDWLVTVWDGEKQIDQLRSSAKLDSYDIQNFLYPYKSGDVAFEIGSYIRKHSLNNGEY